MDDPRILAHDHLLPLLRRLGRDFRLVGPVRNEYGEVFYSEIRELDHDRIDFSSRPVNSLKPFFLPQQEVLASYGCCRGGSPGTPETAEYTFHATLPQVEPTLYFGVRSCDLFAVLYMDMVFLGNAYRDPYYEARRKDAVFVTLGCHEPFADCFCHATRSGPFLELGYDIQLTDLDPVKRAYFVEVGRPRGRRIVEEFAPFFDSASAEDRNLQFEAVLEARSLFRHLVPVDLATQVFASGALPEDAVAEMSERCQDCGGCAFICPTCTCFSIEDQPHGPESGQRVRHWDACTFAGFTRMAGGHNPVDVRRRRILRRFAHKLHHDVERHGRPSCVGCGRCVGICFGGVDMISFIDKITEHGDS